MIAIKNALRGAEGKTSLDGIAIDAALKATLERIMPIYQKRWWPEHDRANREWIAAMQPFVDRHGRGAQPGARARVRRELAARPDPVDLSVTPAPAARTGPANRQRTSRCSPPRSADTRRSRCCSTKARTASSRCIQCQSGRRAQKVNVPPQLSHAVLFYTAGELTSRELKARGIDYTGTRTTNSRGHVRRRLP
jgi:hypothetical protein